MTYEHQPMWRKRSLFKRLFSWPWRPWQREEFVGTFSDLVTETMRRNPDLMEQSLNSNAFYNAVKEGRFKPDQQA